MATLIVKERILVVDDAPNTLEVLQRNLTSRGYKVFTAPSVAEAINILDSTPIDLVITDIKMPKVSGYDLVRHLQENFKNTEVMVITGYPTVEGAVKAVKSGAEEYLTKPFTDEELHSAVRRAFEKLHRRKAVQAQSNRTPRNFHGLLGESEAMHKVFTAITKAASTAATV
ncbi:MAG: sigma-54-dependent transcriptional regulator, partial [Candidatus Heimdallarchaeota archaeon]